MSWIIKALLIISLWQTILLLLSGAGKQIDFHLSLKFLIEHPCVFLTYTCIQICFNHNTLFRVLGGKWKLSISSLFVARKNIFSVKWVLNFQQQKSKPKLINNITVPVWLLDFKIQKLFQFLWNYDCHVVTRSIIYQSWLL